MTWSSPPSKIPIGFSKLHLTFLVMLAVVLLEADGSALCMVRYLVCIFHYILSIHVCMQPLHMVSSGSHLVFCSMAHSLPSNDRFRGRSTLTFFLLSVVPDAAGSAGTGGPWRILCSYLVKHVSSKKHNVSSK